MTRAEIPTIVGRKAWLIYIVFALSTPLGAGKHCLSSWDLVCAANQAEVLQIFSCFLSRAISLAALSSSNQAETALGSFDFSNCKLT